MCNVFPQAASSLKVNMLTHSMESIWVFSRNFLIHTQLNLNTPLDALLKIAARVLAQKARHVEGKRVHGKPSIVCLKKECCSRVCSKKLLGLYSNKMVTVKLLHGFLLRFVPSLQSTPGKVPSPIRVSTACTFFWEYTMSTTS